MIRRTAKLQDGPSMLSKVDKGDILGNASIAFGSPLPCTPHICVRCSGAGKRYLRSNPFGQRRCYLEPEKTSKRGSVQKDNVRTEGMGFKLG